MTDEQEQKTEILRDFAWRLDKAAEAAGLSQTDIADKLGTSRSTVGNWFQGLNFPRKRERAELAKMLDVTLEWLMRGQTENNRFRPKEIEAEREKLGLGIPVREVPVISWTHAGSAAAYEEMPKHFHGSAHTLSKDPNAFGLEVEGDCMEPKITHGDRVIVEPSNQPINGKPVVAKHASEEIQVRLYHKLPSGKIRLAAVNTLYPTVEYDPHDFLWIYPIKELVRGF